MHVWHIGAEPGGPAGVGGVNAAVWRLARWQVAQGARVTLILPCPSQGGRPDAESRAAADAWGIGLRPVHMRRWLFDRADFHRALADDPPAIAVLHSVFLPRLIGADWWLCRAGVPRVAMVHGALAANALNRHSWRKRLFLAAAERPRLMRSDAILLCTPGEGADIAAVVPRYAGPTPVLYNPIDLAEMAGTSWAPPRGRPVALFIGRLDVAHKGIDRLFDMAALLPEVDFRLHGAPDPRYAARIAAMMRTAPPNLRLLPPVFGAAKLRAYAGATVLVMPSRWEGFPLVACEAMAVGTPVALSADVAVAGDLAARGVGLSLPGDPVAAASAMRFWVSDGAGLHRIGAAGKAFATEHCDPRRQAAAHLAVYAGLLGRLGVRGRASAAGHAPASPAG